MSNPFERGRSVEDINHAIHRIVGDDYPLLGLLSELMSAVERDTRKELTADPGGLRAVDGLIAAIEKQRAHLGWMTLAEAFSVIAEYRAALTPEATAPECTCGPDETDGHALGCPMLGAPEAAAPTDEERRAFKQSELEAARNLFARTADSGGLDVERLAQAIRTAEVRSQMHAESLGAVPAEDGPLPDWYRAYAADVAREYFALTPEATAPGLTEAWAEAEGVVYWDWAIRLTRLVKGGYRAEAIAGDEVKVYTVASDPDAALRELSDVITESHVND